MAPEITKVTLKMQQQRPGGASRGGTPPPPPPLLVFGNKKQCTSRKTCSTVKMLSNNPRGDGIKSLTASHQRQKINKNPKRRAQQEDANVSRVADATQQKHRDFHFFFSRLGQVYFFKVDDSPKRKWRPFTAPRRSNLFSSSSDQKDPKERKNNGLLRLISFQSQSIRRMDKTAPKGNKKHLIASLSFR